MIGVLLSPILVCLIVVVFQCRCEVLNLERRICEYAKMIPSWESPPHLLQSNPTHHMAFNRKRRNIEDFFTPSKRSCPNQSPVSSPRKQDLGHLVPGLSMYHDFATASDESALLIFLDAQPWRNDLARRVIHYGGTYCLMAPRDATPEERRGIESNIITAEPVPAELHFLLHRMVSHGIYTISSRPEYSIVNEYKGSQGISAHVENFRFKSPVCGLTLCNGDFMRFRELTETDDGSVRSGKAAKATRTGKSVDIWMPRRSLLVMAGESRDKWQHEIIRSRRGRDGQDWRRVSLTFRTDKA